MTEKLVDAIILCLRVWVFFPALLFIVPLSFLNPDLYWKIKFLFMFVTVVEKNIILTFISIFVNSVPEIKDRKKGGKFKIRNKKL